MARNVLRLSHLIIVSDIPARHQICLPEKNAYITMHRSTPQCCGQATPECVYLMLLYIEEPNNAVDKRPHNVSILLYYVHVHRSTTVKFFNAYFSDAQKETSQQSISRWKWGMYLSLTKHMHTLSSTAHMYMDTRPTQHMDNRQDVKLIMWPNTCLMANLILELSWFNIHVPVYSHVLWFACWISCFHFVPWISGCL